MKLLLCINRAEDFQQLFAELSAARPTPVLPPDPLSAAFTCSAHYLQHEIDICITGCGLFQSGYKMARAIGAKKYHLAIKASFCNAYKPDIFPGEMVNVIKDKPGDTGMALSGEGSGFSDLYDLGLLNPESFPHFKGAFINMNNSHLNVFLPYRKVVSVTVNNYADSAACKLRIDKYKADIETMDGLGFVYTCLSERQPFYQLCVAARNLSTGRHDSLLATQQLNVQLVDILQKL